MKLTAQLKKFMIEGHDVKSTATDDEFRAAVGKALADGSLTMEKYTELLSTKDDNDADLFHKTMSGLSSTLGEIKSLLEDDGDDDDFEDDLPKKKAVEKKVAKKPSFMEKMVIGFSDPDADDDEKSYDIRVKEAADQYSTTKSAAIYPSHTKSGASHPLAGEPVRDFTNNGRPIDNPSELDKAIAGSFAKFMISASQKGSKTLAFHTLPQHDKELLCYAMENEKWGGSSDGGNYADIRDRKLTPVEQKALIDDATSGGLEAAPIVFDDQVIQTPLLYGELFPLVSTKPLERGRRVEGVSTGVVTGSWGGVDDSAISLFDTSSYVSAFDTTIFRWEGAVRIGLDFLSDTPIDFGAHITTQYGERLLEDLDDVIAVGNGTTQPEGIINKSGTTSVNFGAATSIGNYESLRFGVSKAEHKSNLMSSAVFCGTETSYQRARAIPVGASDARRLGGMDYSSYQWMERPYKINESLSNQQIFYAILGRYRMYRRRGLTMRTSTEGDTLIRNNEMLIVATARYGGQLERGACAAVTSTAPS